MLSLTWLELSSLPKKWGSVLMYVRTLTIGNTRLCKPHKASNISLRHGNECFNQHPFWLVLPRIRMGRLRSLRPNLKCGQESNPREVSTVVMLLFFYYYLFIDFLTFKSYTNMTFPELSLLTLTASKLKVFILFFWRIFYYCCCYYYYVRIAARQL